ncbi:Ger(x)C family spore germination protein [Paenibacillus aestuarii]|uniref:Ger(X)C family spore germination C-terminal domain-containing protein n=1 Tax=Paenibacillus aestuarii TaxID=516965 RepID=A0ABW0KH03_9BACL|nr:Ger(x)C family spore germination C-terminal domain-containing protein [Paenibacillus aestuarii]
MRKALLCFILLVWISGCEFKDIDKRFFVVAMGVDWTGKKDKPYLITLRLAIPASKVGEGLAESQVEKVESPSIAEGIRNLKAHVDKEFDFGHCRVFLFGDKLVKESMAEPLNWLSRRRDVQLISFLAVASPNAFDVLSANPTTERLTGNAFFLTFGREGTESPYTVTEYLFDSFRRFKEKGLDPFLPVVSFDGDSYVAERLVLLNKKKETLTLDPEETKIFNLSANKFNRSGIAADYKGKRLALFISRVSRDVSIDKGDVPVVHLRLKVTGMVEESTVSLMDSNVAKAQSVLEQSLNKSLEDLLVKIRDAGVDPYGFGLRYLAQYFGSEQDYEYWRNVYPNVQFQVDTRVVIESTGLVR